MLRYTSDELVLAVRRKAYLADTGGLSDAEILGFINEERTTTVAELIKRASPSFWRTYYDFTVVAGQSEYRIPDRALMSGIEEVVHLDSTGRQEPIIELEHDERWKYSTGGRDPRWPGTFAYVVEGEHIRVMPAPGTGDAGKTLRVWYYRQPSMMVLTSYAHVIDNAVSTTSLKGARGANVTAGALNWLVGKTLLDVVRGDGMFGPIATDRLFYTGSDATYCLLDPTTPVVVADIAAGTRALGVRTDYVCLAGETVFTEFPKEVWPVLVSASAIQCLLATKDFQHASAEMENLRARIASCSFLAEPRSKEPDVIVNRGSSLRRGR
jgi:hypothetical protein